MNEDQLPKKPLLQEFLVSYSARDFELFLLRRELRFLACHTEETSGGSF